MWYNAVAEFDEMKDYPLTHNGHRFCGLSAAAKWAAVRRLITPVVATLCIIFALALAKEARGQTAGVPGKPVVRAVAADFATETFTLRWHAPKVKGDSQITAYRIRRSQNIPVVAKDADPAVCATLLESEYRYLDPVDITDASQWYEHASNARGDPNLNAPGVSFGNCYRWHISAVNAQGAGAEATTPPILSRGLVLGPAHAQFAKSYDQTSDSDGADCPAGQFRIRATPDDWADICLPRGHIEGADRCQRLDDGTLLADYTAGQSLADGRCRLSPASATSCEQHDFRQESLSGGLLLCSIITQCGVFSEYNIAHRACQCEGLATPASEGDYSACQCAVGGADPATCQCPADLPYNSLENACGPLLPEYLLSDSVDLELVRAKLNSGADPNQIVGNTPILIHAATLGLAEVVSVLITAGADPDARHDGFVNGLNAMHYMAGHQLTSVTRQRKWEVMRHFGDAVSVRGATFAWDALYNVQFSGLSPVGMLQRAGEQSGGDNVPAVMQEMSNYMMRRGGRCVRGTPAQRYHDYCLGDLGVEAVSLILDEGAGVDEVERALQTARDGGLTLVVLGNAGEGGVAFAAASQGRAAVMSVLITAGAGYAGGYRVRGPRDRNIPQRAALLAATRPADALSVLLHYIGAHSVLGTHPGGWSHHRTEVPAFVPFDGGSRISGAGAPLQLLDNSAKTWVGANPDGAPFSQGGQTIPGTPHADILEMHALIVEYGGACRWHGGNPLCFPPEEEVGGFAARDFVGAVLTVTARALAGFNAIPGGATVAASLEANGWTLSLNASPDPDEAALYRTRAARTADAGAIFTLTLTNSAANAAGRSGQARYVRVFGEVESLYGVSMIAAMRAGDWDEAREHLGRLTPLQRGLTDDDGISPLIIAATLGNAPMVAALVTFGFDPDARSPRNNAAVPHLMTDTGATNLTLGLRAEILYSFGDAVETSGAVFDWNADDSNGVRALDLLRAAAAAGGRPEAIDTELSGNLLEVGLLALEHRELIGEMADYVLARGGECEPKKIWFINQRYHRACTGGMGVTLAAAALTGSADEVRAAAQAIVDAGVTFTVGLTDGGEIVANSNRYGFTLTSADGGGDIVAHAARHLRGPVVSILITFGLDPDGVSGGESFNSAHWIVNGVRNNAMLAAEALDYLLGGLAVSDRWADYEHWNTGDDGGDFRYPLDQLRVHGKSEDDEFNREIQALVYEAGGRCRFAAGRPNQNKTGYCALPEGSQGAEASPSIFEDAARITARAYAGFDLGSISPSVRASLTARGWTVAVDAGVFPTELRVGRTRIGEDGDAPVFFTATLTNWAGEAARRVSISVGLSEGKSLAELLALGVTNLVPVRAALDDADFDPDGVLQGVPYLIYAATLGYAGVVSVLITAGADPEVRRNEFGLNGLNAMHYMAGHQLTSITRQQKWEVMRHFGDAVSVRSTVFAWTAQYLTWPGLTPPAMLQRASEVAGADNVPEVMRQMSSYMMERGGRCYRGSRAQRFHDYCMGEQGAAIVSLALGAEAPDIDGFAQTVRAAVDAGYLFVNFGSPIVGPLPVAAAALGRGAVMSIVMVAGGDYDGSNIGYAGGRDRFNINIPQHAALLSDTDPGAGLSVARHFAGALAVLGTTYGQWNHGFFSVKRALQELDKNAKAWVAANPDGVRFTRGGQAIEAGTPHADILETQALMYEHGAACQIFGGNPLCFAPEEDLVETPALDVSHVGGVLTITARAYSDFKPTLLSAEVAATLEASGWTLAINTVAEPDEVVLERHRAKRLGDKAANFTLIMTNSAGAETRFVRVDVNLNAFLNLLRAGEPSAGAVTAVLAAEDPNERLDGVPVVIVAATLGYEVAVSILITAGADPAALHDDYEDGLNAMHHVAGHRLSGISRAEKWKVMRHFGDAVSIREAASGATLFHWDSRTSSGTRLSPLGMLQRAGERTGADNVPGVMQEMSNYMVRRGGRCFRGTSSQNDGTYAQVYHDHCLGDLGIAVVSLAMHKADATRADVERVIREALDGGLQTLAMLGHPLYGQAPLAAASQGRAVAVSVLITAGAGYDARGGDDLNMLQYPALVAATRPSDALAVLRHYLGAVDLIGGSAGNWNHHRTTVPWPGSLPFTGLGQTHQYQLRDGYRPGAGSPLQRLDVSAKQWVAANPDGVPFSQGGQIIAAGTPHPDILEIQSVMYEHDGGCRDFDGSPMCHAPEQSVSGAADISDVGKAALTITARALSGFKATLIAPEVSATLEANGWTVSLNTAAEPDEAALIRARSGEAADQPARFFVTLTNAAARDTRIIQVFAALESSVFRSLLLTPSPNLASLRQALDDGANPNSVLDGVPVLIAAATLGHAGAVSVLITAGADPGATHDDFGLSGLNAMHYMAGHQATISRADKRDVMRHFGDAVREIGADFDWNRGNQLNNTPLGMLRDAVAEESGGDLSVITEMADYVLSQGGGCPLTGAFSSRYHSTCVGTLGAAVISAVNAGDSTAASVLAAAVSATAAGVSLRLIGDVDRGPIAAVAAFARNGPALSVLLTMGAPAEQPNVSGARGVLHQISRATDNHADEALTVLQYFIGGLSVAGKLSGYGSWNSVSDIGRPLNALASYASDAEGDAEFVLEIHSLMYEQGARCAGGTAGVCGVPAEEYSMLAPPSFVVGGIVTMSARAHSSFRPTLISDGVAATLEQSGWTLSVNTAAEPDEAVLHRLRAPRPDDSPALFTVQLTNRLGQEVRYFRVSVDVANSDREQLVFAVREGNLSETRRLLSTLGLASLTAEPRDENNIPLLIEAARSGHAEVVSVLVTFGLNPDVRHPMWFNLHVPHLMATYDGTPQEGGGELPRADRLNVLRHFGDAVKVRGTLFDWNDPDMNNHHFVRLLEFSENNEPPASDPLLQEMADYALTRGMHCGHISKANASARYGKYCAGTLGAAMAAVVNASGGAMTASIVAAAVSLTEAGFPLLAAGDPVWGGIVERAAFNGNAAAVSILVTFGGDAEVPAGVRGVPHQAARTSQWNPAGALNVLRHFIGGLSVAGKLSSYGSWSRNSDLGAPLEMMNTYSTSTNETHQAQYAEMHSLLYEQGSRCDSDTAKYCAIPADDFVKSDIDSAGAVFTMTARANAGFHSPPVPESVRDNLERNGWTYLLNAGAAPAELTLFRIYAPTNADEPVLSLTITLTSSAGAAVRHLRALATLAVVRPPGYDAFVSVVLSGDADETSRLYSPNLLNLRTEEGPALLVAAATLGHAEVVSVLVTLGYNPDARLGARNIARLMADASPATLNYGRRWEVLRHFADAMEVRGTMLADWQSGQPMNSLRDSYDGADAEDQDAMLLMANYYLARGGFCVGDINYRYRPPCVGSFGITLKDYANQTGGSPPDDDVRVAAQAAVDAGIPPDVLGVNGGGELVGLAAHRNNAGVVSILITFGFDPSGRGGTSGRVDWTALHHAAIEAEDNAPGGLNLLRHFIGGLQGAALLESFSDWNPDSNQGRPLDILQSGASANTLNLDAKLEMHSLLYELGATCASDTDDYCGVPAEDISASEVSGLGGVFTITARMFSDFAATLVSESAASVLLESGWDLTLVSDAAPEELVLTRIRAAVPSDMDAVFTVALTSRFRGHQSRLARASVALAEVADDYELLISAVRSGDDSETARLAPRYVNAADEEGVPLPIIAATLGHAEVVSVLIAAGFDSSVSYSGNDILRLMTRRDAATLVYEKRRDVLFAFGAAVDDSQEAFDWNNGLPMNNLRTAYGGASSAERNVILQMGNYLLARGGACTGDNFTRYNSPCVGTYGETLSPLANMNPGSPSDDAVRAAMQEAADAGIDLDILGAPIFGALPGLAAHRGHSGMVSILLTFGMNPSARGGTGGRTGWAALHHAAITVDDNADKSLELIQHFIGGLRGAGSLDSFSDWNADSSRGRPLDIFQEFASQNEDDLAAKRKAQVLLYERGARCSSGGSPYCDVPTEEDAALDVSGLGPALAISGRGVSGETFSPLPTDSGKGAELLANGWEVSVISGSPPSMTFSRARLWQEGDMAVALTVSLLSNGEVIREYRLVLSSAELDCAAMNREEGSAARRLRRVPAGPRRDARALRRHRRKRRLRQPPAGGCVRNFVGRHSGGGRRQGLRWRGRSWNILHFGLSRRLPVPRLFPPHLALQHSIQSSRNEPLRLRLLLRQRQSRRCRLPQLKQKSGVRRQEAGAEDGRQEAISGVAPRP